MGDGMRAPGLQVTNSVIFLEGTVSLKTLQEERISFHAQTLLFREFYS